MRSVLKFLLWTGGILGVVGLVLYVAAFDLWTLPSDDAMFANSVEPMLRAGDHIVVSRSTGGMKPGYLVRCPDPDAAGRFVVGRVLGEARDKIEIEYEIVLVNGKRTPSPRACEIPDKTFTNPATGYDERLNCAIEDDGNAHGVFRSYEHPEAKRQATVEADKLFLVSDNRHFHLDSRDFGQIQAGSCQHILFRLWGEGAFSDGSRRFNFLW